MKPTITAFRDSPDRGQGLARDMPVRWALEEVGQSYGVRLLTFAEMKEAAHRARQPFGQIPSYEDGSLAVFETGAIVLQIAERHAGLLPRDEAERARAITWTFAAVSTIEPPIVERDAAILVESDQPWFAARQPLLDERVRLRLTDLSRALGDAEWLGPTFSAGDLMMVSVLRRSSGSGLLEEHPNLVAYVARGEARPAFRRAFEDQYAVFLAASRREAEAG